jgi:hypothetical protein
MLHHMSHYFTNHILGTILFPENTFAVHKKTSLTTCSNSLLIQERKKCIIKRFKDYSIPACLLLHNNMLIKYYFI